MTVKIWPWNMLLLNKSCLFFSSDNGQEFGGSIYHKVNPNFETAVTLAWAAGNNDTRFGIGCKYNLDSDTSVRAKVNNSSHIGLSYSQKLREGLFWLIILGLLVKLLY